jgi:hypothetical protein
MKAFIGFQAEKLPPDTPPPSEKALLQGLKNLQ